MRRFAIIAGVLSCCTLSTFSAGAEAANPGHNNPQQQAVKQRQALQRTQALRNLAPAQRRAHIRNVVLPKLRTRITEAQNKINSKDKLIKGENKRLAKALTQSQRAKQDLDATDAQIDDTTAAMARKNPSPAGLEKKLQNLRQRKDRLQNTVTEANNSIAHHRDQIRTLNGERKTHSDRLAKNLKLKREGKEILSGKGVMPQYGQSSFAAGGDGGRYQPAPAQSIRGQALDARPVILPAPYLGRPAQQAAQAVNPNPQVPPNTYGQLALRPAAGQQTDGPRPDRPIPPLPRQAEGVAGEGPYQALPNAALQAQRGLVQAVDGNGNQVMLPPAPAAVRQ